MAEAYIVAVGRTAGGRRDGKLKEWHPADLAGKVIDELLDRSGADPEMVEDVIMGCVTQSGSKPPISAAMRFCRRVCRKAAGHLGRPPMRFVATIHPFCGSGRDVGHYGLRYRRRC